MQDEGQLPLDREERIAAGVRVAYTIHGYVDDDQEPMKEKLADTLFGPVSQAVAEKKADREKVLLTRKQLTRMAFPETPGPEAFGEQDDPELAEDIWNALWKDVWSYACNISPKGPIQERLNGDYGLVLVRLAPQRRGDEWGVYVTRDYASLNEDVIRPTQKKQEAQARSHALYATMLMERLPDQAKKIQRQYVSGLQTGANIAKELTKATLASLEDGRNNDDSE